MKPALLAIDQGTTGSSALVISGEGHVLGRAYSEFTQHFPAPGRVEHDAEELWRVTVGVAKEALAAAGAGVEVVGVGITNQRETVVLWDPETLDPLHKAVVWQDRRSSAICEQLRGLGHEEMVRRRTGLLLDPYFSGTKLRWLFEEKPELAVRARSGELAVGTIDSWLIARLTAGRVHATEHTNASRTLLYDLDEGDWADELLDLMRVPRRVLPEIRPSSGSFGVTDGEVLGAELPICGVAGDQQAALYGHGCWDAGSTKSTYGTGAFLLCNTGRRRVASANGLLTTVACDAVGGRAFALEGSVLVAGAALQWLRDELGFFDDVAATDEMARGLDDNGGVYMVPAFAGLGTPHWCADARGTVTGLTRGTTARHLVRAALEAMAYGTRDVVEAMERDTGLALTELRVDGGATRNDWLLEFMAGVLDVPVRRSARIETTALGVAGLAGLHAGLWGSPVEFRALLDDKECFLPQMKADKRNALLSGWEMSVKGALAVAGQG